MENEENENEENYLCAGLRCFLGPGELHVLRLELHALRFELWDLHARQIAANGKRMHKNKKILTENMVT